MSPKSNSCIYMIFHLAIPIRIMINFVLCLVCSLVAYNQVWNIHAALTQMTCGTRFNFRWWSMSQKIQLVAVIKLNAHQGDSRISQRPEIQFYTRDSRHVVIFENNTKRCDKYRRIGIQFQNGPSGAKVTWHVLPASKSWWRIEYRLH